MSDHQASRRDYAFRDVQARYEDWASAQGHATQTTAPDAERYALRLMEEALDDSEERNAILRREIARSAHDYARLLARTTHTRRERAPWRDYPLALAATVWDALVGEDRHSLTGFLACILFAVVFVATLIVGPGGR